MKPTQRLCALLIVLSTLMVVTAAEKKHLFKIPIIGLTEESGLELIAGFASGAFGEDQKDKFLGCLEGIPELGINTAEVGLDVVKDIRTPSKLLTADEAKKVMNLGTNVVSNGIGDVTDCITVGMDVYKAVFWGIKHFSLTTVTTGLLSNLLAHILDLFTHGFGLVTALFSFNYFKLGQEMGTIFMMLFN